MEEIKAETSINYYTDRVKGQISITNEPNPHMWISSTLYWLYEALGPFHYSYKIGNLTVTGLEYNPLYESYWVEPITDDPGSYDDLWE